MDYYGAGADLARMRADEDREMGYYWDCTIKHLHFGLVGKFPPDPDECPAVEEDERCFECPVDDTPYVWCNTRLEETPAIIIESLYIITMQDINREIEEVESMYQEYKRREDGSLS